MGDQQWAVGPDGNLMKGPGSTVSSGVVSMSSNLSRGLPPNLTGEGKSGGSVDSGYPPSESAASVSSRVLCDACPETAVKRCDTCMNSYCETHASEHSADLEGHHLQDLVDNVYDGVPPPGPIQFSSVLSNSVTLSWSPPEGAPKAHRYRVTRRRGTEQRSLVVAGLGMEVTGLIPGETYHFAVASLSADGHQGPSVNGSVRTEVAEVPPPENLTVDPRSLTASLKWTKPAGVDQVSYLLEIFRNEEHINTIDSDGYQYTISGLQYGTDYSIRVSTVLSNGLQSKPTSRTFTTEVPSPENLTVDPRFKKVSLKWTKPAVVDQVSYLLKLFRDQEHINTISTDDHQYTITGLQSATDYNIRVSTVLSKGRESKPACKAFKTFLTDDLRIVLLGKTGVGKSASGNTILGRKEFRAQLSLFSVTQHCEIGRGEMDGVQLCVIDTPGLFDICRTQADIRQEIEKCIAVSAPGPHVFLMVVKLGRFTLEEQEVVKYIQSIFGEGSVKYTIVLFTHGDYLEEEGFTVEDIMNDNSSFRKFVHQYQGGYHVFNNRRRDPSQVRELLHKIDKMVAVNEGSHYTKELWILSYNPEQKTEDKCTIQ